MRALGAYAVWLLLAAFAAAIVRSRRRAAAAWQPVAIAAVAAASLVAFTVVGWGRATPFGDFAKAYYAAGVRVLTEPSALYACEVSNLCFVNLPVVALAFTPLAALGRPGAETAFTIAGAAAVILAAVIVTRELGAAGASRYAIAALFALNGPLMYSIRLGNVSHALLPLVALAFVWIGRGREVSAGIALAILAANKLPFLLFLSYLLLRCRWIAAGAFVGSIAVIVVTSLALFGTALHETWLDTVVGPFARWPLGAYNVQSVASALTHYLMPGNLTNWVPLAPSTPFSVMRGAILLALTLLVGVTLLYSGTPRRPHEYAIELQIVLVLALLASPLTWTHYYAFLVVPLAGYAAGRTPLPHRLWALAVAAAAVLVSLPVVLPRLSPPLAAALVERVLISHYTWGALLLLAALCTSRFAASRAPENAPSQPSG